MTDTIITFNGAQFEMRGCALYPAGFPETHWRNPTSADSIAAEAAYAAALLASADANPHDSYFAVFEFRAWEAARARVRYDAYLAQGV